MDVVLLLVGLVVGAVLGVLIARLVGRGGAEAPAVVTARHEAEVLQVRADAAAERSGVEQHAARLEAATEGLERQVIAAERRYAELREQVRRDGEAREAREGTENRVLQQLAPVRGTLAEMQQKVAQLEAQRAEQHGQLSQQLRQAVDAEERLRTTAESLASALRSNSTRGVWGETQLRSVVEAAGLINRVDFDVQTGVTVAGAAYRPDMVVHLPGGKSLPVDAKVPFTAYLEAVAVPATASDAELARRDALMADHVRALRGHISALGSKAYWDAFDAAPEMVIAFIPSESLIASALEADPTILEFAFAKRVALASPVTLWSLLKTVAFTWQQDVVTAEAKQLFDLSRELHGRLTTMAGHVAKLGRAIDGTVKDYNSFVGSLERQVLPSARKLQALDESKVLASPPPIESAPRELVAPELLAELEAAPTGG